MKCLPLSNFVLFPLLFLLFFPIQSALGVSAGDDSCESENDKCIEVGSWDISLGLGYGQRSNPLYGSEDQLIVLLPNIQYYGKRLTVRNLNLSYLLLDSNRQELNWVMMPALANSPFKRWGLGNFVIDTSSSSNHDVFGTSFSSNQPNVLDTSGFEREYSSTPLPMPMPTPVATSNPTGFPDPSATPAPMPSATPNMNNGVNDNFGPNIPEASGGGDDQFQQVPKKPLRKRETAVLGGLDYRYYGDRYAFAAQWLQDISSVHNGMKVRLAASRAFGGDRSRFVSSAGVTWLDKQWLDYYYGFWGEDLTSNVRAYHPKQSYFPFARLDWYIRISPSWTWQSTVHYEKLSEQVVQSPIVEDDVILSWFFGGVYHF